MKNTHIFFLFFFFVVFTSCTINGALQGLVSYYKKTKKESPQLLYHLKEGEDICNYTNNAINKVVVINGKAIMNCMNKQAKSIIYFWSPKCKSKVCYPIQAVQDACAKAKIPVFIVAEYYDVPQMSKEYNLERPIIGIDIKYYKTNFTDKYVTKFFRDVSINNANIQRFSYFENGIFIKSYDTIDSIGM